MIYPSEVKKASTTNSKPKFLSRKARAVEPVQTGYAYRLRLSGRAHRLTQAVDSRLVARGNQTQLHPCPECDGCGLHKVRCGFYMDRAKLQAASNPKPSFNGMLGQLARAMGPLGAHS